MTGAAPLSLDRRVFIGEGPLLINMTLKASRIRTGRESRLFHLETTMRIVAVCAADRPFQNLMVKRRVELVLYFAVTSKAELRIAHFQHS